MIKIKKGLNLPILGSPTQKISEKKQPQKVAIIGPDFNGMKPTMLVKQGELVKAGQPLFTDKKNAGVVFTSPVNGEVLEINRGARRAFESVVIKKTGDEHIEFNHFKDGSISDLSREEIVNLLVESGEWAALRTRPYSKSPRIDTTPHALFINGMDTNPLAADSQLWLGKYQEAFTKGVMILSRLTSGMTFVCLKNDHQLELDFPSTNIKVATFSGPHPAGNTGTHIHFLSPASANKTMWSIGYQDVIAIGKLFTHGKLFTKRLISMAGPGVNKPKIMEITRGSCLSELVEGETIKEPTRVISGSVLNGRVAKGSFQYLGRFHNQVSVIEESFEREFLGWQSPGFNKFSVSRVFISKLFRGKKFNFNTLANGSPRAIVPIGSYEKVMPLDIQPTYLLRALMAKDTDMAQKLGVLELDEEDIALCTFVDPSKHDFGPALRNVLETIEKEG